MPICALDVLPIIALLEVVKPLLLPGRNEISTVLQLSEASSQQQCCSQLDYIVPALYLFTPIEAVEHWATNKQKNAPDAAVHATVFPPC